MDPGYLQHYGVKGMKWGVRKDEDTTSSSRMPSGNWYLDNDNLSRTYQTFKSVANNYFNTESRKSKPLFGKKKTDDEIREEAYQYAASQLSSGDFDQMDTLAIMALYDEFERQGLSQQFTMKISAKDGQPRAYLTHKRTGRTFGSFAAAKAYMKSEGARQREKNVQGEAVSIKKRGKAPGGSVRPTLSRESPSKKMLRSAGISSKTRKAVTNAIGNAMKARASNISKRSTKSMVNKTTSAITKSLSVSMRDVRKKQKANAALNNTQAVLNNWNAKKKR